MTLVRVGVNEDKLIEEKAESSDSMEMVMFIQNC